MGVRTTLNALTLQPSEIAQESAVGQDLAGNLEFVTTKLAEAIDLLTVMQVNMPSGTNKTAFAAAIASLS